MLSLLSQLDLHLRKVGVESTVFEATESAPYDRLLVLLGPDYKERDRLLEVTIHQEKMDNTLSNSPFNPRDYLVIRFQFLLPFSYDDKSLHEVSSLILMINRMIELPGFELDELNNRLFYRYVLLTAQKELDSTLCVSILGLILMVLDLFTESLEKLATGEVTFVELLEKMSSILGQLE